MKITKAQLKSWGACKDGYEWFLRHFPAGAAEYQDVLNALAEDDRPNDADWLMNHAGPDAQAVIEVEDITDCKHFFAAGRLIIKAGAIIPGCLRAGLSIEADTSIRAGWGIKAGWGIEAGEGIEAGLGIEAGEGIEAGWGIKAGRGIKAGWGIKAGGGIEAGEGIEAGGGMGIFAGLRVRVNQWALYAQVIAKTKPDNLVSGSWVKTKT